MSDVEQFFLSPEEILQAGQGSLHELAIAGMKRLNAGEFFEAHEDLELAWRAEPGAVREMYRGILQVAVACHHMRRGNYAGAVKMFRRAAMWLAPYPEVCRGVRLEAFRGEAARLEAALLAVGEAGLPSLAAEITIHISVDNLIP